MWVSSRLVCSYCSKAAKRILQPQLARDIGAGSYVHTSATLGDGNLLLRHIADYGQRPFSKCTLEELFDLQEQTFAQRLRHLEESLHVGISKIVVLLQDLPLGFGSVGHIRTVIHDYVLDLKELRECSHTDAERFLECVQNVFARHRGVMSQIARGLEEFQTQITSTHGFEPFAELAQTTCANVSLSVPAVRRIELALDEFFTIRVTLRLLMAHSIQLHPDFADKTLPSGLNTMHELLGRLPDSLETERLSKRSRRVGAICMETRPSVILIEAYRQARLMCLRDFNRASDLCINGDPLDVFLHGDCSSLRSHSALIDTGFPYVDVHLFFMFFEVLKNALMASIHTTNDNDELPPIHASLIHGSSLLYENERTVKISDSGEGIRRSDVHKVWSYFYSNRSGPNLEADREVERGHHARGLGLPVSRVLVRYFGGELDINSIPTLGSDVFIYL